MSDKEHYSKENLTKLAQDYIRELQESGDSEAIAKKLAWQFNNMGGKEFSFHMSAIVSAMTFFNAPLTAYWSLMEWVRKFIDKPKSDDWGKAYGLFMKQVEEAIQWRNVATVNESYPPRKKKIYEEVERLRQAVIDRDVTHMAMIYGKMEDEGFRATTFASCDNPQQGAEMCDHLKKDILDAGDWKEEKE